MKKKNNGGNSGPLTSLPVDHLNGAACNADARAKTRATPTKMYKKEVYLHVWFLAYKLKIKIRNFGDSNIISARGFALIEIIYKGTKTFWGQVFL